MKVIVEPDAGLSPVLAGIRQARQSLDLTVFRFDLEELERALETAVTRGVRVRTLIAQRNHDGEKALRKLELRLLQAGVTVSRTDDELVRYHDKLMIVDHGTLYVLGFNYTRLDMNRSRSFGIVTRHPTLVQEAVRLFEADSTRQPYTPGRSSLIVSPLNARQRLAALIQWARRDLLIYDPKLTDRQMIRLLQERVNAGVRVRILGKLSKRGAGLKAQKMPGLRLHVRVIVADGRRAFVGSQSLRKLELDARRELGVIMREPAAVRQIVATFEADWARTDLAKEEAAGEERDGRTANAS